MNDPASPKGVLNDIGGVFSGTAMVLEPDGTVVDVVGEGSEAAAMVGDASNAVGESLYDRLAGTDAETVRSVAKDALETGTTQTVTCRVTGVPTPFAARITSLDSSEPGRLLWVVESVTEENDEAGLVERILEVSPIGLVVVERSGEISLANARAEEILDLERKSIAGRAYTQPEWNVFYDDGTPISAEEHPVTRVFESGEPVYGFEHWIELADGTERWLSSHSAPIHDESGEVERVVVALDDATATKERTERLRWLTETEELGDIGGWELDVARGLIEGTAGMSSLHAGETYGPTFEEVLSFYHPEDRERLRAAVADCAETGTPFELELRRETSKGAERWVRVVGERVAGSQEPMLRGVVRDVTRSKERRQRLSVINRILRHNLRNKLNVVAGNAERMRGQLDRLDTAAGLQDGSEMTTAVAELAQGTDESQPEIRRLQALIDEVSVFPVEETLARADRIESASGRLAALADRVREFEAAVRGDDLNERIDVRAVIEALRDEYADEYPEAVIEVAGTDAAVTGSWRSIRLLVEIPLENALEHHDRSSPRVRLAVHDGDERVHITVTDDGPGVPERERAVIREGEETPLFHGTGVGLWTLDWLVTRLGGEMTIAENEGRGTTVTLVLPHH
jgi:PAS domain S-box-containing protein